MRIFQNGYLRPPGVYVRELGRFLLHCVNSSGGALLMLAQATASLTDIHKRRREIARQMWVSSYKSFVVTEVVALFTGMILSLQAGLILREYGQQQAVGTIVAETMVREMGPFMTALIIAASVGSAMAAELGTMAVSEELDALTVMGIDPVRYLVMPRLLALVVMVPALAVFTNIVGILGGGLVARTQLAVNWDLYYSNVRLMLDVYDIYVGMFKAVVFGVIIGTISCYQGLITTNGAVGVGRATRRSVVLSFLMVLIVGYMLTRLFY